MRRIAVLLAVTGILAAAGAASAATPGGTVRFFAEAVDTPTGPILFTGAIGDFGKATSMDKNGKPDSNGNFVKVVLRYGSFMIDATKLNAVAAKAPGSLNRTTCSFYFQATGPARVYDGAGRYKGISGTVSVTITFAGDGPLFTSGKRKGTCNTSNSGRLLSHYGEITGTGTVSFS
jgi:hypothetical protein